ncbi:MAG: hypothetical protein KDA93_25330 [Planctomycetaceae bacterium]|nr:hypothetical protein [Planctomycetaceae bacterium]
MSQEAGLRGVIQAVGDLDASVRVRMFDLMEAAYEGVTWEQFHRDLEEKDQVILLQQAGTGDLQGFSTVRIEHLELQEEPVIVLFSGDTIVEAQARGDVELARQWLRLALDVADAHPERRMMWFLICSGYKTYRMLPVFFEQFVPRHDVKDPTLQRMLHEIANGQFPEEYDQTTGIIRLPHPTPLRSGVADITPERLRDPHVAYFVERNPRHDRGDELACLTEITRKNLTRAGRRILTSI